MNSIELIKEFKKRIIEESKEIYDDKEIAKFQIIFKRLNNIGYLIKAIEEDFSYVIENEEVDRVMLFDLERNMFWKPCKRGYTEDIFEAGLYDKKYAIEKCNEINSNTKIVYYMP